jgi:hypothetical protein
MLELSMILFRFPYDKESDASSRTDLKSLLVIDVGRHRPNQDNRLLNTWTQSCGLRSSAWQRLSVL